MKILLIIFLSVLFSQSGFSEEGSPKLNSGVYDTLKKYGFKKHHLPLTESESSKANNSVGESYLVSIEKDNLIIKRDNENYKSKVQYKSKKYTFIGTDRGEWGGKLEAVDKKGKSKILLYDNIIEMIYHNKSLYVFTGLAHLSMNRGAIYKVNSLNNSPSIERLTLLPGQPSAIFKKKVKHKASFLIVTSDGLVSYEQQDKKMKNKLLRRDDYLNVYLSQQFWYTLYPNSIVELENKAIFGIRSGIVVVTLGYFSTVKEVEYFTK